MKIVKSNEDFCCPNCNAKLQVEDSEDFESSKPMQRNDSFWMECPECECNLLVDVQWEPTYTGVITESQYEEYRRYSEEQNRKCAAKVLGVDLGSGESWNEGIYFPTDEGQNF